MFKFQLWGPFVPNCNMCPQEIHLPMECSKSEKFNTTVGSWWCSRKVLKMPMAGKAYTTVGSWWRKTDYGLEFRDERGGGDNTNKMGVSVVIPAV